VADLVAPGFIFAIGLNYRISFRRRFESGGPIAAYRHFLLRYLALIGIGAILSAGGTSVADQPSDWGVLQAIGVAGLICLPLIRLPAWLRFAIGGVLLVAYQVVLETWALPGVLGSDHGGFVGAVSWGALLVVATAVADVWRRGMRDYGICCALLVVTGIASALLVPLSKNRVSLSYVLLTLAIAAVAFLVVDLISRLAPARPGFLSWWGENPITLYVLHLLLLGLVVLPPVPAWYAEAPLWLTGVQLAAILVIVSLVAWRLHRGRLRIDL
jgi:hypothetical protein